MLQHEDREDGNGSKRCKRCIVEAFVMKEVTAEVEVKNKTTVET